MFVIGLTGSIGMGKSTTAGMFEAEGILVNDADAVVHQLYAAEAVAPIEAAFPGTTTEGKVDRAKLAAHLAANPADFKKLESIVHPLVREKELQFRRKAEEEGRDIILLDIPLLFETAGEGRVDAIVVVTCAAEIQRARVLSRPGMTVDKFEMILSRQMPDSEKRRRANYIVDTGEGLEQARAQVRAILADIRSNRLS